MMRGKGVAAHDVEGHQLRPPLGPLDAGLTGVTRGSDFAGMGFEVLRADPGAAPDQGPFADFSWGDPQD